MKYILLFTLLVISKYGQAQVPNGPGSGSELSGNMDVALPQSDQKLTGYYLQNGKYGFVTPEGIRQTALYTKIDFNRNGFIIQKDGLFGIADKKGQVMGTIKYDSVGTANATAYIVKKNGKYGSISTGGNKILSVKYNKVLYAGDYFSFVLSAANHLQMIFNEQEKPFASDIEHALIYANLAIIKCNGKFGVVKKQLVIPIMYDSIFVASPQINTVISRKKLAVKKYAQLDTYGSYNKVSLLTLQNGSQYGLSDSDGMMIYPVDNDAVNNQEMYQYYTVKKGNLYGIYFIGGKQKTGIEFDKVYADGLGFVMANKNQKGGVFNLQGRQIVPFEYDPDYIMQLHMGFGVKKNKKKGIVSKDGKVLVPAVYDDVDTFYENGLTDLIKVRSGDKFGIINLKGETVIPVEYGWIGELDGLLKVMAPGRKFGLYTATGKVIVPAEYQSIINSDTEGSNIIVLKKDTNSYYFLNKTTKEILLNENVTSYGLVLNQDGLLNPMNSSRNYLMFLKGKNGKKGLLNELTGALDVPLIYDDIIQRFDTGKKTFYSVRNGKKYGLIDQTNRQVVPLEYNAINLDLVYDPVTIVVEKGNKFGAVSLTNQPVIPFQYVALQRISRSGLYKANTGTTYQIIDSKNQIISQGPYDDVANFENEEALTFYKGNMRVINDKGIFLSAEVHMLPHNGYKTFDELKLALINALDNNDDGKLRDFAAKIAPSEQLLFYLKENPFSRQSLQNININAIQEKYYNDLLQFKRSRWNQNSGFGYNHAALTEVTDYTVYQQGLVTNIRISELSFGDTHLMEKLLRNAFKVNGFWISSYFMQRNFDR